MHFLYWDVIKMSTYKHILISMTILYQNIAIFLEINEAVAILEIGAIFHQLT